MAGDATGHAAQAPSSAESPVLVVRGDVLCYRVFDVADELDLAIAERILGPGRARRWGLEPRAFAFPAPPLAVDAGAATLDVAGRTTQAACEVHLFDSGAACVLLSLPIERGTALATLAATCAELFDSASVTAAARERAGDVMREIGAAARGRHEWPADEGYTVIQVQELAPPLGGSELLALNELPRLLLGERPGRPLSAGERAEVLQHAHSYLQDDLVVCDWDSAFVLEPSGSRAVADVLELATVQLLELRYHDDLIDAELAKIRREFQEARRRPSSLLRNPHARLSSQVLSRLVELTGSAERVENAVKILGDPYLARVHASAVRCFRIGAWQASVERKLSLAGRIHELLARREDERRSRALELAIVLLIVVEIVAGLLART